MKNAVLYILTVLLYLLVALIAALAREPDPVEQSAAEPVVPVVAYEPMPEPAEPEQRIESTPAAQPVTVAVVDEPVEEEPLYTEDELETLAIIIYQEAGGDACDDSTRQMVGEVFLNRVADDRFPDSFYEVATQEAQYGRLYWTGMQWPERASNAGEAHAVQRAYDMAEALLTGSVERLLPADAIWQAEFTQGTEVLAAQDGFYFCR